ncbi:type II toxin-antitoxin system HicB family antitoxin [candidate division WWE3 bacterium CG_4_9_14_3_um_filter_34_6]|uniref:Type II toxin-antitoxin system HicB family antitoxin n=1 Tax=candidate division WWE3 bacterium CG_4_9_14_3_um_filter_34_6 TaxID=1975079 RepID=A0A2M7X3D5_UNCKA|nr:MAG: type II toxin-antitoxin system HicB family antitoxin [candidate division WWE3 bacterium CG_4_9_14_3_um_filter_34_6]
MKTKILNYRIIVTPDVQTGTNKPGFTAVCPILGVADDGDTVEKALRNIKVAIQTYIDSLVEDKIPVPVDQPQNDIVTTTQVTGKAYMKFA